MKLKSIIHHLTLFKLLTIILITVSVSLQAQLCGTGNCGGTVSYANFGFTSNNNAATIEYDNFASGFHNTVMRAGDGNFKVWGYMSRADGLSDNYSPSDVNATNYPGLTGTPLKLTTASSYGPQFALLTTTGLFAWGTPGMIFPIAIKNNNPFSKLTINGQSNGLPVGVQPGDVKMLTAGTQTLGLLTCSGDVYMLTQEANSAGAGLSTPNNQWNKVITASGASLSNIVVLRINRNIAIALDNTGNLWTWGQNTYKAGGAAKANQNRATELTKPNHPSGTIKMIGVTKRVDGLYPAIPFSDIETAFYVLYTDGNLYSMGGNTSRQLGDWTTTERRDWVQPRYNSISGPVMNNIKWISPIEHDAGRSAINVITNNATLYNWGNNHGSMLGRPTDLPYDPAIPGGLTTSDRILVVNSGGHTTMAIRLYEKRMGYVGHYVNGSQGNGQSSDDFIRTFQWVNTEIEVCGTVGPPVQNISGCNGKINLSTALTAPIQNGTTIRWFTTDDPSTGTQVTNTTSVSAGTYYAFYYNEYINPQTGTVVSYSYSPPSNPVIVTGTLCPTDCVKPGTIGTALKSNTGISTKQNINTNNWPTNVPNGYLVLDSSNKGFVITHMTTAQRNSLIAVEGMIIYNIDLKCIQLYRGNNPSVDNARKGWNCIAKGCNTNL